MTAESYSPPMVHSTFLFTDVEGSTRYWIEHPGRAGAAFARHDELLTRVITGAGGIVVKGTGDGFMAAFESPMAAVRAAIDAQLVLQGEAEVLGNAAHVRMALNTGDAELRDGDYYGLAPVVSSRLMSVAHGGQILISEATRAAIAELPSPLTLVDLGEHRLKDLSELEHVFQVVHPDLRAEFPPINSLPIVETSLPVQATTFIGREMELHEVAALVAEHRLVTLTGAGGVGKTRLAVEVASTTARDHPDGIWFVDLASTSDGAMVPRAVADSVGISETVDRVATDQLVDFFRGRRALLLVDNCEQVVAACAALTEKLLSATPNLHIVATSRERLRVAAEAVYRVPSMSAPGGDVEATPEVIEDYDAVRLFVSRARLAHPGFSLTPDNALPISSIVRHLDGIPLALELAAANVAVLSPNEISARLDDRFRLLGGRRGGEGRHLTLRAAIDWGYELLDDSERRLFARLAVFRGGFDLEAVAAVCGGDGVDDVGETLIDLVEKSLVMRTESERFGLLESLREYASERLALTEESDAAALKHATYFARVAETTRTEIYGANQAAWVDRLSLEHDNVRAALRWALEQGHQPLAARIAGAAWVFWKVRGHLSEGRDWLARVLEHADSLESAPLTEVLVGAADLAIDQGDLDAGRVCLERARDLAGGQSNTRAEAAVVAKMASLPHKAGDFAKAIALSEEALDLAHRAGDDWVAGRVLPSLALLHEDQGHHDRAASLAGEALDVARRSANPYLIADAALSAGEIALNREEDASAGRLFEEAAANAETVGIGDVGAWSLAYLGKLAIAQGEFRRARSLLERSIREFDDLDYPIGSAWALCHLGRALQGEAEFAAARRRMEEALRLAVRYVQPDVPVAIEALGVLAAESGELDRAVILLASAQAARKAIGLVLALPEQRQSEEAWSRLRGRLSRGQLEELTAQGRAMSVEESVAFALGSG